MSRGVKNPMYKAGDVVMHRDPAFEFDYRIVFAVDMDCYYYLDKRRDQDLFLNPTHSAVGHKSFEDKYKKVGRVESVEVMIQVVGDIQRKFGDAFLLAHHELPKIKYTV